MSPAREKPGEDPLVGHDAVAHALGNGAARMTFLADLRDLQQHVPAAQACADGQPGAVNAVHQQALPDGSVSHAGILQVEFLHLLPGQQADLPVPVARVGVTLDAPSSPPLGPCAR